MTHRISNLQPSGLPKTPRWTDLRRRFTEPAATVRESDRHRVRLLSALLVIVIPLGVLSFFLTLLDPSLAQRSEQGSLLVLIVSALIFLSGAYALSRSRYYTLAAALTVGITVVSILVDVIIRQDASDLAFLIVGILIAGLFFSGRGTGLVVGVMLSAVLMLSVLVPGLPWEGFVDVLFLLVTVGVLALVSAAIQQQGREQVEERSRALNQAREELETRVQQRTTELAQANQALQAEITERKQMEDVLRESEERYRTLAEAAQDTIFIIDREQRIYYINNPGATRLGARPEEIVGKTLAQLFPPQVAERQWDAIREVFESGKSSIALEKVIYPIGEAWMEALLIPLSVQDGEVRSVMGVSRDVTARKQAEQEIQRRANEFVALYETTRDLATMQRDLPTLLQTIAQRAVALLAASSGAIYLYEAARGDLEIVVTTHPSVPVGLRLQLGEGMAGKVARSREPMIVDDYRTWQGRSPKYEGTPLAAAVEVPMLYGGELVGVLAVQEMGETIPSWGIVARRFTEEDARLLSLFAGHAASAVYDARLLAETKHRADEFAALYETARDLATAQDLSMVLQTIVERATALLGTDSGSIFLYDAARQDLEVVVARGPEFPPGTRFALGEGMAGRVAQTHAPLIVDDYRTWEHRSLQAEDITFSASIEVPMLYGGELVGVLAVNEVGETIPSSGTVAHKFTEEDARLLSLFAGQAAGAVHNARLFSQAQRRLRETLLLNRIITATAYALDSDTVLQTLCEELANAFNLPQSAFALLDTDGTRLTVVAEYRAEDRPSALDVVIPVANNQLIQSVLENRAPRVVSNAQTDGSQTAIHDLEKQLGVISMLIVPLLIHDRVVGTLQLDATEPREFSPEEIALAQNAVTAASPALENARLYAAVQQELAVRKHAEEDLQRANGQLETSLTDLGQRSRETLLLIEMGDLFQACRTAEEAHGVIRQSLQELFPGESGALYIFNASRDLVEAAAFWGESPPSLPVFQPDACWGLRRGKMHVVQESGSTVVCGHLNSSPHSASLCVPMMAQGDTLGILTLTGSAPAKVGARPRFTESEQQLVVTVAEHIALALANLGLQETLRHQAIRDPLTNLFNRRYMEETLGRELSRVKRKGAQLGIVMLDIDHFKRFNDTFGHDAGDIVLRELGRFLQSHVRAEDIACRLGGEEFTLIIPETSLDIVQQRTEEIRVAVKQMNVLRQGQLLGSITLSMGVSFFPEHGAKAEDLFRIADAALYRAKAEGRDRVVIGAATQE